MLDKTKTTRASGTKSGEQKIIRVDFSKATMALPGDWQGDRPPPPPDWRIKYMMVKHGLGVLSGPWGVGKTYIAIDMSVAVATGQPFAGRDVHEPAGVIYISPERPHTILRRLKVAVRERGIMGRVPFYRAKQCPRLTDDNAAELIIESVKQVAWIMRRKFGVRVGLIVIDTLVVAAQWDDERNNSEIARVVATLKKVSDETGAFVLTVDHFGKDASKGTRGAYNKEASADLVLHVENDQMVQVKCSEGEQGIATALSLVKHEIGKDDDDAAITECTVSWTGQWDERQSATKDNAPLGANEKEVLTALTTAMDTARRTSIPVDAWEVEAMKVLRHDELREKRQAFKRAMSSLIKRGKVVNSEGMVGLG
jgi:hypothetical protein